MLSLTEVREHARALRGATPDTVLTWAVETFPRKVTLTVSFGGGGVVLAHLISRIDRTVPVMFLDTRFHFPETYAFKERFVRQYGLNLVELHPLTDPGPLYRTDRSGGARAGGPLGRHHEDRVRAPHLQREAVSGDLVDRVIPEGERAAALERAGRLRSLTLDPRTVADLELIATGGYSPLTGFLGSADYQRVIQEMRLADGRPWPLPITLRIDAASGV